MIQYIRLLGQCHGDVLLFCFVLPEHFLNKTIFHHPDLQIHWFSCIILIGFQIHDDDGMMTVVILGFSEEFKSPMFQMLFPILFNVHVFVNVILYISTDLYTDSSKLKGISTCPILLQTVVHSVFVVPPKIVRGKSDASDATWSWNYEICRQRECNSLLQSHCDLQYLHLLAEIEIISLF